MSTDGEVSSDEASSDEASSGKRSAGEEVPAELPRELSERFKALSERAKRLAGSRAGRQAAGVQTPVPSAGAGDGDGLPSAGAGNGGGLQSADAGDGTGTGRDDALPPTTGDEHWMGLAIEAGEGVRGRTSPNPWVGAVVVPADGREYFTGATAPPGGPHAEIAAIAAAGERAAGSTLYVTLEPCAHHGRTPPCTEAVVAAGIRRVVVGMKDPDRLVSGAGIDALTGAGIDVVVGVGADAVSEQLAPYACHRLTGRPWVVLKLAATLDGRTAAPDGTSQWLTGDPARADAHRLRSRSDAVLVGAGTVRTDDPALTVRLPPDDPDARTAGEQPLRVVLGHVPSEAKVHPALELEGDLGEALDDLGRRGVIQLLVEGGPSVAHAFHAAGLVDRYVIYLAPALFGGDDALPLFAGPGAPTLSALWRGSVRSVTSLGGDLRVELSPRQHPGPGQQKADLGRHNPGQGE